MLIKPLVLKKEFLTTVEENCSLAEALTTLEESGFRCVPILDETGTIFRGNIYKMHIYRHKSQGGDMSLPVTTLLKNATKTIPVDAPFFQVFFNIKDLPYITVLDEHGHFYGILTHAKLLGMLSEAWNIKIASYVLTVFSTGKKGDLVEMSKIISKYCSILGCMTLDANRENFVRRTLFTLPAGTTSETLKLIVQHLERKQYRVAEIEDLQNSQTIRKDTSSL